MEYLSQQSWSTFIHGSKSDKDQTICYGSFAKFSHNRALNSLQWSLILAVFQVLMLTTLKIGTDCKFSPKDKLHISKQQQLRHKDTTFSHKDP